ncbi:hypothetical protein B0T26DRAFT_748572 [Lasiosphaeria miniovina]|uniref:Uncharacterized protein n=1 Tax=Lasiosphaeria miniovina TaxID=1954250 RepID=A0AA40B5Y9_9PEZI|nr:uncharacterized protein B0T26DRAFT_748572 [Lasiosphaeria miniovina]KAK0728339.1 hypothetical protein B0T26DRAFT_748572 [Lasiosphaeria miniovina]
MLKLLLVGPGLGASGTTVRFSLQNYDKDVGLLCDSLGKAIDFSKFEIWKDYFTAGHTPYGTFKLQALLRPKSAGITPTMAGSTVLDRKNFEKYLTKKQALKSPLGFDVEFELLKSDGTRFEPDLLMPLDYLKRVVKTKHLLQADLETLIADAVRGHPELKPPQRRIVALNTVYVDILSKNGFITQQDVLHFLVGKEKDMVFKDGTKCYRFTDIKL